MEILGWIIGFFIGLGIFIFIENKVDDNYKPMIFIALGMFLFGAIVGVTTTNKYYENKLIKYHYAQYNPQNSEFEILDINKTKKILCKNKEK